MVVSEGYCSQGVYKRSYGSSIDMQTVVHREKKSHIPILMICVLLLANFTVWVVNVEVSSRNIIVSL